MNKFDFREIISNKRAHYKFTIENKFEAGIVLLGWEVKSARFKLITIDNSYISFISNEAYIYNSVFKTNIQNNQLPDNSTRIRKLLLKKKELWFLKDQSNRHNYTIIILNLFWKNNWIKANIAIAKGKKKYDKRYVMNTDSWKKEKIHITKCINK